MMVNSDADFESVRHALANLAIPESKLVEIDNLDIETLKERLRDSYQTIAEKERDLLLAAEIGQSLLQSNNEWKSKYDTLITEIQSDKDHNPKSPKQVSPSNYELGRLESENLELRSRVETLEKDYNEYKQTTKKHIKKLEDDVTYQKKRAEESEKKYEEVVVVKDRLVKEKLELKLQLAKESHTNQSEVSFISDLEFELSQLRSQTTSLTISNSKLTKELSHVLEEAKLHQDRVQFLEGQINEYRDLQESYKYQAKHIIEMSELIEDQRSRLSQLTLQLEQLGVQPAVTGSALTRSGSASGLALMLSNPKNLIGELEAAWARQHGSKAISAFNTLVEPSSSEDNHNAADDNVFLSSNRKSTKAEADTRTLEAHNDTTSTSASPTIPVTSFTKSASLKLPSDIVSGSTSFQQLTNQFSIFLTSNSNQSSPTRHNFSATSVHPHPDPLNTSASTLTLNPTGSNDPSPTLTRSSSITVYEESSETHPLIEASLILDSGTSPKSIPPSPTILQYPSQTNLLSTSNSTIIEPLSHNQSASNKSTTKDIASSHIRNHYSSSIRTASSQTQTLPNSPSDSFATFSSSQNSSTPSSSSFTFSLSNLLNPQSLVRTADPNSSLNLSPSITTSEDLIEISANAVGELLFSVFKFLYTFALITFFICSRAVAGSSGSNTRQYLNDTLINEGTEGKNSNGGARRVAAKNGGSNSEDLSTKKAKVGRKNQRNDSRTSEKQIRKRPSKDKLKIN
ncbi:hypothetical protein BKA69DRAFT_1126917 [Paraphysoderma sedebokerense]|nr:hypothetical protein BKA69DRAFT_1126917 [Paraphysoderma sedebokerense]